MFEFSKMIFKNNFVEKNFLTFLKRNNLIITDLHLKFLSLEKLKARIASLDEAHQTCGNYLLFNKNLIKELNDKNNNLIRNKE